MSHPGPGRRGKRALLLHIASVPSTEHRVRVVQAATREVQILPQRLSDLKLKDNTKQLFFWEYIPIIQTFFDDLGQQTWISQQFRDVAAQHLVDILRQKSPYSPSQNRQWLLR